MASTLRRKNYVLFFIVFFRCFRFPIGNFTFRITFLCVLVGLLFCVPCRPQVCLFCSLAWFFSFFRFFAFVCARFLFDLGPPFASVIGGFCNYEATWGLNNCPGGSFERWCQNCLSNCLLMFCVNFPKISFINFSYLVWACRLEFGF